jgi:AcrR family transcriptional regulator
LCDVARVIGAPKKSSRRIGAQDSVVRTQLLDSAEGLMLEEGYAAVSSRRLAAKAGLTQPLVYYYFRTMDELFLAVFRRMAEQSLERLKLALCSEQPLRALWDLNSDRSRTALTMEFLALANHRKVVQAEIARYAEELRAVETRGLTRLFAERKIEPLIPPLVVTVLLTSLARGLVQERALSIAKGHSPTHSFVEECLRYFEAYGEAAQPLDGVFQARRKASKPRARKATAAKSKSRHAG